MSRALDTAKSQQSNSGPVPPYVAGKNAVINGGFDIWQRGTSFTGAAYCADRWFSQTSAGTTTFARESTIVPAGSQYAMKWTQATAGAYVNILQAIETSNAMQFANKIVTLSAQVAASASQGVTLELYYATTVDKTIAGAGWTQITPSTTANFTPSSTTYIPASTNFFVPSTAKTLMVAITTSGMVSGNTFYVDQIQLELGSSATSFSRAGGDVQGELAACQRYYYRAVPGISTYGLFEHFGVATSSTTIYSSLKLPVTMRTNPSSVDFSTLRTFGQTTGVYNSISNVTINAGGDGSTSPQLAMLLLTSTGLTTNAIYGFGANNSTSAYIGVSAEL
jgi:hypothetical protein